MTQCPRCSALPAPILDAGTLCIAPPLTHTLGTLCDYLRRSGVPHTQPVANLLAIPLCLACFNDLRTVSASS